MTKRKSFMLLVVALLLLSITFVLAACDDKPQDKTFSATFDMGEFSGDAPDPIQAKDGEQITLPQADATFEGHTFAGWKTGDDTFNAGDKYTMHADVTFVAQWSADGTHTEKVTVSYEPGFDQLTAEQQAAFYAVHPDTEVDKNSHLTLPQISFERDHYDFAGWDVGGDVKQANEQITVTANTTITATWTAKQYTVTFTDGEPSSVTKAYNDEIGTLPTYNGTAPVGQEFDCWQIDGQPIDAQYKVTGSATATAKFKTKQYTVTFKVMGDTDYEIYDTKTVNHGDRVQAPNDPLHDTWTFKEWMDEETGYAFDMNTEITKDYTLEARFMYKFSYELGEYVGDIAAPEDEWKSTTQVGPNAYKITLPQLDSGITVAGKDFAGWKVKNGDDTLYQPNTQYTFSKSTTFVAQWKTHEESAPTYEIEFHQIYEGGQFKDDYDGITGEKPTIEPQEAGAPVQTPQMAYTRKHYSAKWRVYVYKTDMTGSYYDTYATVVPGESFEMPAQRVFIAAYWTGNTVEVIFDPNGGSGTMASYTGYSNTFGTTATTYNSAFTSHANKIKALECTFTAPSGKKFVGWSTNKSAMIDISTITKLTEDYGVTADDKLTLYAIWEENLEPVIPTVDEIVGKWTTDGNEHSAIIVKNTDENDFQGYILIDGQILVRVFTGESVLTGIGIGDKSNTAYTITLQDDQLQIEEEYGETYTFSNKTDAPSITMAPFYGKFGIGARKVYIHENGYAYTTQNGENLSFKFVTVGDNLVFRLDYTGGNNAAWFILSAPDSVVEGYVVNTDSAPAKNLITPNSTEFFVLLVEGEFNQIALKNAIPNADMLDAAKDKARTFEKWVLVEAEQTEFDPSVAMSADANIKAVYAEEPQEEAIVYKGNATYEYKFFGSSSTYAFTQFEVKFGAMEITYTVSIDSKAAETKTATYVSAQYPSYKPADAVNYYDVTMANAEFHIAFTADNEKLILCDNDDNVLGEFTQGEIEVPGPGPQEPEEELPAGDVYETSDPKQFNLNGETWSIYRVILDETGKKAYIYYTVNGEKKSNEYTLTKDQASWHSCVGKTTTAVWLLTLSTSPKIRDSHYLAIHDDGTLEICLNATNNALEGTRDQAVNGNSFTKKA